MGTSLRQAISDLESSPKYSALSTDKKLELRSHLFDKYVAPYYQKKGVTVNDESKDRWVKAGTGQTVSSEATLGKPTLVESGLDAATHFYGSLAKGGTTTARALIDLHSNVMHGFVKHLDPTDYAKAGHGNFLKKYDRYTGQTREYFDAQEDRLNRWLGSDYNKSLQTKVEELPGQVAQAVGKHPGYILAGEFVGGVGAMSKAEPLTEEMLQLGAKSKYAYKAIRGAAEGYLASRLEGEGHEGGVSSAKAFAGIEAGISLIPFLGKLLGMGGPQVLENSMKAVVAVGPDAIEKVSSDKISNVTVKATAKALNEVAQNLGFKDFWDAQAKGKSSKVFEGVGVLAQQATKESAVHNPELVAAQAQKELEKVEKSPLGKEFIGMLRKHSSNPVKDTVAHVVTATAATSGMPIAKSTVGAASATSLEFSDNLSKLLESNVTFEKRSHKFLAALDMMVHLQSDLKAEGKESPKWLNEQFMAIQNQLDQDPEFRNLTMTQRIESAKNLMDHVEQVMSKGKGDRRIWRSTEVRPGFDKTSSQKQLSQLTSGKYPQETKGAIKARTFTKTDMKRLTQSLLYEKHLRGDDFYAARKVVWEQAHRISQDQNISSKEALEKALSQLGGK